MQAVRDEAAMVQDHARRVRSRRRGESDRERAAISDDGGGGEGNGGGSPVRIAAFQVRRRVDLDAEFGDVVLARRLPVHGRQQRHLDRIRARDHDRAVEEEQGDGMVQARDRGCGTRCPALAELVGGVVDQGVVCGIGTEAEALCAAVAAAEEDDSAVGEEDTFDHATPLRHAVHFPFWRCGEGLDAATGGVGRGGNVLIRSTATDDDVGRPVVGCAEGEQNRGAGIGVGAVVAGEIGVCRDGGVGGDVEGFRRFRDEDEEGAIGEEVDERVHVVRLILCEDVHGDVGALRDALVGEDLVRGVVVGGNGRVETVQTAGCYKDCPVGHDLGGGVPTCGGELVAGFTP